jgi:hypothetical protein
MTPPAERREEPAPGHGGTTAGQGTPLAVDMSTDPRARSLIVLVLAGPVIWSVHFMLVYLIVEAGCFSEGTGTAFFAPWVGTVVTLVATAVAAVASLAVVVWGWRRWQADRREEPAGPGLEPPDRGGSLAFLGFLLAGLGFVAVLFVGVPALFLSPCLPS